MIVTTQSALIRLVDLLIYDHLRTGIVSSIFCRSEPPKKKIKGPTMPTPAELEAASAVSKEEEMQRLKEAEQVAYRDASIKSSGSRYLYNFVVKYF